MRIKSTKLRNVFVKWLWTIVLSSLVSACTTGENVIRLFVTVNAKSDASLYIDFKRKKAKCIVNEGEKQKHLKLLFPSEEIFVTPGTFYWAASTDGWFILGRTTYSKPPRRTVFYLMRDNLLYRYKVEGIKGEVGLIYFFSCPNKELHLILVSDDQFGQEVVWDVVLSNGKFKKKTILFRCPPNCSASYCNLFAKCSDTNRITVCYFPFQKTVKALVRTYDGKKWTPQKEFLSKVDYDDYERKWRWRYDEEKDEMQILVVKKMDNGRFILEKHVGEKTTIVASGISFIDIPYTLGPFLENDDGVILPGTVAFELNGSLVGLSLIFQIKGDKVTQLSNRSYLNELEYPQGKASSEFVRMQHP